jgi:NAD(P)-dependent dehydrogenase (short-subunit alcohol dehydrogenase family)
MAQTILIYGGSSGIGAATARIVRARGDHVHLVGRDRSRLESLAGELGATFTQGDVNDAELFARATQEAVAQGALAGLVYAVGTINLKPLTRLTDEDFIADFKVNALGAAKAVQAAVAPLKRAEGTASIVLFSTVAVAQGFAAHASVAMAKGAVEGLSLSLAAELAPKIRVNVIAPSLTRTPLARSLTDNPTMAATIAALHPLPRLGEAEDAAELADFLLSSKAGWITGQVIGVDGGRSSLRVKG